MPNDDMEQMRLALIHQVCLHVLNGDITTVQLEKPNQVLDIGTGTGEWAIRFAEMYPECEVVGTDISAIAETKSVPMNVFFEIEDAEDWDRPADSYDLIHFRYMEGAFTDWNYIYENVFYSLKRKGWIEMHEFDCVEGLATFLSQFPPESPAHALQRDLLVAAERSGRPRGIGHLDTQILTDVGFTDVKTNEYLIPITVAEKTAGKIWLIALLDSFEATCLRLLTTHMGWEADECRKACEDTARELVNLARDPESSQWLQVRMVIVTARKPLAPPAPEPVLEADTSSQSEQEESPGLHDRTVHGTEVAA